MFIDTHAHVNFHAYDKDNLQILQDCLEQDTFVINVGSQFTSSKKAVELADKFDKGIFAIIGLHPIHLYEQRVDEEEESFVSHEERFDPAKYKALAKNPKVVGIGECGLEYFQLPAGREEEIKNIQEKTFIEQINFASATDKVLMVHCRDAYEDLHRIIQEHRLKLREVVIHSFIGNWEEAEKFLQSGCHIGFNGIITFKPRKEKKPGGSDPGLLEAVRKTPLDRILLETDCPYLSPEPNRGQRNWPVSVKIVAQKIAEIKGIDVGTVEKQTTENARKVFKI